MKEFCETSPTVDRIEYPEYEKHWGAPVVGFSNNGNCSPRQLIRDLSNPENVPLIITSGDKYILLRTKINDARKLETRAVFKDEKENVLKRSMRNGVFNQELGRLNGEFLPHHDVFAILEEITRWGSDNQGECSLGEGERWIGYRGNNR